MFNDTFYSNLLQNNFKLPFFPINTSPNAYDWNRKSRLKNPQVREQFSYMGKLGNNKNQIKEQRVQSIKARIQSTKLEYRKVKIKLIEKFNKYFSNI